MSICFDHIYFRPKISAACFKISFSILNCWFSFRSRISSSCSGVRLSFSWKEPELDACFTHLSNREVAMSYSRQISHLRLPERYSSTSCCLNSSVYLRGLPQKPDSSMFDGSRSMPSLWWIIPCETSSVLSSMMFCITVESVMGISSGLL